MTAQSASASASDPEIIEITYGRTINVGNYESVRLDLTARVPAGKDYTKVLDKLKHIVDGEEALIRAKYRDFD